MRISRRIFLRSTALMTGGFALGCTSSQLSRQATGGALFMPAEGTKNVRTWMAFVANNYIWSSKQIPEVKRNLALIATTIAQYEPVSVLVSPQDLAEAQQVFGDLSQYQHGIQFVPLQVDDLWLRDTGPTFVFDDQGQKYGINFNFNGWGGKQHSAHDVMVADFISASTEAIALRSNLTLEGGSFEIDGHGAAILTRSAVLNDNRNPNVNEAIVEKELKKLLGIEKIIWLEGIKGKDITDGHVDFYARFVGKGEVLVSRDNYPQSHDYQVTRQNIEALQSATDLEGNPLKVTIVDAPDVINEKFGVRDFAAGYLGYYLCNGAVIMQKFGDQAADQKAKEILAEAFPDRAIEQIAIDGIASGGGSVHCATQQEPAPPSFNAESG